MKLIRKAGLRLLILPFLVLIPFLRYFILSKGADYSDLLISHYPNALLIQTALLRWGEIPLWSGAILSGFPFSANPLSGLHYPPGWLALVFPQPFGLNIIMALHILLGGLGMYRFLIAEGRSSISAWFGAVAFGLLPKIFSHLGAGHVTIVYAVAWTPWLLLLEKTAGGKWWRPAAVLGLIALADLRWAALGGILWLAYSIQQGYRSGAGWRWLTGWMKLHGVGLLMAFMLGAWILVPLYEYAGLSTRWQMTAEDNLTLSLPPAQLIGGLMPPLGSMAEWVFYPGGMVLVLVLVGFGLPGVRRRNRFWLALVGLSLIYSLGSNIPGMAIIAGLPGFDLLRVPPRALFVLGFSLVVIASATLQGILDEPDLLRRMGKINPLLFGVAVAFGLTLFTVIGTVITRQIPLRFAWGSLALVGGLSLVFLLRAVKIRPALFGLGAVCWLLLDLGISNGIGLEFRTADQVLGQGGPVAAYLIATGNQARVYSPSYSLPQQTAAFYGIDLADGIDPLQLDAYAAYMKKASGVDRPGYSVTLPSFPNGDAAIDNKDLLPNPGALGKLNVGYVAAEFDLRVAGLVEEKRFGSTRLYRNALVLPTAWVQSPDQAVGEGQISPAALTKTANTLTVRAEGPGLLVLSELAYPGWTARIDGSPAAIQSLAGVWRGVDLPPGLHLVTMVFQAGAFWIGAAVSLIGILIIFGLEYFSSRRTR